MSQTQRDRVPLTAPAQERARKLHALGSEVFDVLVIGAGIGGACTAWDAALRGLKVALIDRADFGGSTSAHSLKVLHGGIRYLQHLDITRLRESCAERAAFLAMAPHLTRPMPFALPTFGLGMRGKWPLRAAFTLLNIFTAGRNAGIADPEQHIPPPFMLGKKEFLQRFPAFDSAGLNGAGVFYDGQIHNPPRMVFSIVRSAQAASAIALNYVGARRLLVRNGTVEGVSAVDELTGEPFDIRARLVANMSGPYAPVFVQASGLPPLNVPLSRDMAFVIKRPILTDMGIGIQTRYKDPDAWLSRGNRHLFMVPWRGCTLMGVNSRVYRDDPSLLQVSDAEVDAFIEEINDACPALAIRREDIEVVNAGLLPFGENDPQSEHLSFGKRSVLVDHGAAGGPRGVLSGMSVRWTMGRLLGEQAVDLALRMLGEAPRACRTRQQRVDGGDFSGRAQLYGAARSALGNEVPAAAVTHLADTFGTQWKEVAAMDEHHRLLPESAVLEAEVRHVARSEMAPALNDIVLRRLDLGTATLPGSQTLDACARIAGEELGWSDAQRAAQISQVRASFPFAGPQSQQGRAAG